MNHITSVKSPTEQETQLLVIIRDVSISRLFL